MCTKGESLPLSVKLKNRRVATVKCEVKTIGESLPLSAKLKKSKKPRSCGAFCYKGVMQ